MNPTHEAWMDVARGIRRDDVAKGAIDLAELGRPPRQALAELPERQRMIVGLRDVEGLSAEDVCRVLDVSPVNQRVLLHRGRSRLRAVLESYLADDAA